MTQCLSLVVTDVIAVKGLQKDKLSASEQGNLAW